MATIFSHALAAGTIYNLFKTKKNRYILFICLIGSIFPDIDVLTFRVGIPYEHMFGHRGFTHSILFAILYSLFFLFFFRKDSRSTKVKLFTLFFLSIMSHGLFDMLTNGGLGVGLFIPFTAERYFFPYTPLEVSPIGKNFFSLRGLMVLKNEFFYIMLPSGTIMLISWYWRKIKRA